MNPYTQDHHEVQQDNLQVKSATPYGSEFYNGRLSQTAKTANLVQEVKEWAAGIANPEAVTTAKSAVPNIYGMVYKNTLSSMDSWDRLRYMFSKLWQQLRVWGGLKLDKTSFAYKTDSNVSNNVLDQLGFDRSAVSPATLKSLELGDPKKLLNQFETLPELQGQYGQIKSRLFHEASNKIDDYEEAGAQAYVTDNRDQFLSNVDDYILSDKQFGNDFMGIVDLPDFQAGNENAPAIQEKYKHYITNDPSIERDTAFMMAMRSSGVDFSEEQYEDAIKKFDKTVGSKSYQRTAFTPEWLSPNIQSKTERAQKKTYERNQKAQLQADPSTYTSNVLGLNAKDYTPDPGEGVMNKITGGLANSFVNYGLDQMSTPRK